MHYIFDTVFDPADDYRPWNVVKVYRDGNPIHIDRFATEEEADDFVHDLRVLHATLDNLEREIKS